MWIQIRSSFGSLCPRNRRSGLLQTRRGNYVRVAPHPRGAALKFRGVSAQRIFAPSISPAKPDASVLGPYRLERAWRRSAGRRGRYFVAQTLRADFAQHETIPGDLAGEIEEPSSRTVRVGT